MEVFSEINRGTDAVRAVNTFLVGFECAENLMKIVNDAVNEDEQCRNLTLRLLRAIEDEDGDDTAALTAELDEAIAHVFEDLMQQLKDMVQDQEDN